MHTEVISKIQAEVMISRDFPDWVGTYLEVHWNKMKSGDKFMLSGGAYLTKLSEVDYSVNGTGRTDVICPWVGCKFNTGSEDAGICMKGQIALVSLEVEKLPEYEERRAQDLEVEIHLLYCTNFEHDEQKRYTKFRRWGIID